MADSTGSARLLTKLKGAGPHRRLSTTEDGRLAELLAMVSSPRTSIFSSTHTSSAIAAGAAICQRGARTARCGADTNRLRRGFYGHDPRRAGVGMHAILLDPLACIRRASARASSSRR